MYAVPAKTRIEHCAIVEQMTSEIADGVYTETISQRIKLKIW